MSCEKVNNVPVQEAVTAPNKIIQEKKLKSKCPLVQSVLTSLKSLPVEKQLLTLISKYEESTEENKKLLSSTKRLGKEMKVAATEKKKLEQDNSKYILAKSRLEGLCRELQKQNKLIKQENIDRLRKEEIKRRDVSDNLHKTMTELSQLVEENSQRNSKLKDENQNMSVRLHDLVKQHQEREERVEKAIEQKQLEVQLSETKLAKIQLEFTSDKEKLLHEKKALLEELAEYQKKVQLFSATEVTLRSQLKAYSEKYEEFQGTLDKSNEVFKTFKSEMDEMTKNIKRHEKETRCWRQKWENAQKALLQMVNERTQMETKILQQDKQLNKLQSLCRALQQLNTELRTDAKNADLESAKKNEENKENDKSASLNRESLPKAECSPISSIAPGIDLDIVD